MSEQTGIVHIGVGNFHRSHEAVYVHRLLQAGGNDQWGICGVGMLPGDAPVRDGLRAQGFAYSVVVKHLDRTLERQEITSIRDFLLAPEDPWAVVARLADPATRVVSLTITEGGYNVDDATGQFDTSAAAVVADAVPGAAPLTVFGVVVRALQRRRDAGRLPFTVVSCDNIESNGQVARRAFTAFAALVDPELALWMQETVAFPSSMVDRITPATTDADRALVLATWGVTDRVPVTAEPFTQWVLEDAFTDGRPPLERVGVQLVQDVRPYELMKLRLLNAGHQAMAYIGLLLGHQHVHDAALDPDVVALLTRYLDDEATGTLEPVPGVDLADYKATLLARFSNREVADTLLRLAAFASDRIPKFVLPVIAANVATGGPIRSSSAVVAGWLRYLEVQAAQGRAADVVDRWWTGQTPEQVLAERAVFGDLVDCQRFVDAVLSALGELRTQDPRAALRGLLV